MKWPQSAAENRTPIAEPSGRRSVGVSPSATRRRRSRRSLRVDLDALKLDAAGSDGGGQAQRRSDAGGESSSPGVPQVEPGEGVAGLSGDDYLASLLALPDLWTPLAERFDGQLYVAAPASDYVIFADARAKGNLARIAHDAAVLARAAKRPLSTDVFEWTPTGWEVIDLAKAK